jgi:mannose-1-phosphate guanylyltransferase
MGWWF